MSTKLSMSINLLQHNCKLLIPSVLSPLSTLVTLTACMFTRAMVKMGSVWLVGQVLTALLFFIRQRILPASTLVAGTVVLTLILYFVERTQTATYLRRVHKKIPRSQH